MEYYKATAKQLYDELERLQYSVSDQSNRANQAINLISKTLRILRKAVRERGFETEKEEIYFFKHIKPQIAGHLIFYRLICELESKRMVYTPEEVELYIKDKKKQFSELIRDNMEFVFYYHNRYQHMDKMYFLRETDRIPLWHQNTDAFHDPEFTTPYDHIAAKLVAKDLFYKFLLKPIESASTESVSNLKWTESKTALIELIYALNESGAIDEGQTDIKTICTQFERLFNVEIKDIYGSFRDISMRKTGQTKFLSKLSLAIQDKINKSDEL
ncbi:MAG: RteC domain-containing protein [Fluviicola sp.]